MAGRPGRATRTKITASRRRLPGRRLGEVPGRSRSDDSTPGPPPPSVLSLALCAEDERPHARSRTPGGANAAPASRCWRSTCLNEPSRALRVDEFHGSERGRADKSGIRGSPRSRGSWAFAVVRRGSHLEYRVGRCFATNPNEGFLRIVKHSKDRPRARQESRVREPIERQLAFRSKARPTRSGCRRRAPDPESGAVPLGHSPVAERD